MFCSKSFFRHRFLKRISLMVLLVLSCFFVFGTKRAKNLVEPKSLEVKVSKLADVNEPSIDASDEVFVPSHPRFDKFMKFIGVKLKAFQKDHMPLAESVFYPFGGPDLLYPFSCFLMPKLMF